MPRKPKFDLHAAAATVAAQILTLVPTEAGDVRYLDGIPKLFEDLPYTPDERCSIFWELDKSDNGYGRYADDRKWHPYLRTVRNGTAGRRLFATFSS
jgi:hypothetical protein